MTGPTIHFVDPIAEHYIGLILPRRFFELGMALAPGARSLYLQIVWRCNIDGTCYESVENLGEHAGMTERTARDHLKTLVKMRMVSRETRNGETHLLQLVHPEHWRTPVSPLQRGRQNLPGGAAKSAGVKSRPGRQTEGGRQYLPPKGYIPSISSSSKEEDVSTSVHSTVDSTHAKEALLDKLLSTYNSERFSRKGELPEAQVRTPKRTRQLLRFAAEAKDNGLDPVETMRILTRYLALDDHYLGKGGGKRYGIESLLANGWKHYEAAAEHARKEQPKRKFQPGQRLWHKTPSMREREPVTVDRGLVHDGKLMVYRGDATSGPLIAVEVRHLTPRDET